MSMKCHCHAVSNCVGGIVGVRLIYGTADRGTEEPAEPAEPTKPPKNDCCITTAFG